MERQFVSRGRSMKSLKFFFLCLSLLLLSGAGASATDSQSYQLRFFGESSTISFANVRTQDGNAVEATVRIANKSNSPEISVDRYEPEDGIAPEIKSVFTSGKAPRKLYVIVGWASDDSSIETGGTLYEVYAYDEKTELKNGHIQLIADESLTNRLGVGFDGTREGRHVTYKFKTAPAVKRQLATWGYK